MVDSRTACTWQRYVDQDSMKSAFQAAMRKLSLLGQDTKNLIDCTEVIPVPKPLHTTAHFPAGSSYEDIQRSVWTQILASSYKLTDGVHSAPQAHSRLSRQTLAPPPPFLQCKQMLFSRRSRSDGFFTIVPRPEFSICRGAGL
jgi:hypothetical protein